MDKITELYRKLNSIGIPEIDNDEGEIAFTPDQMIWFGKQAVKNNAEQTLDAFFDYIDDLPKGVFESNSLDGHKRVWLKALKTSTNG